MKKNLLFSLWLTILTLFSVSVFGQTGEWIKVSDITQVQATKTYAIVDVYGEFALSNDNGTTKAPNVVDVTITSNKITSIVEDKIKWNISYDANTQDFTFYPNGSTSSWLYITNTNNGVRVGVGADNKFKSITEGNYKGFLSNTNDRYIGVYNDQDWRSYLSSTTNIENTQIEFFEFVPTATNTPPTLSNKTINGTYGVLLTNGNIAANGTVTTWFEPTGDIPTGINYENGVFSGTPTQAGTFVAYVKANNQYGDSNEATVTFIIAKETQTISGLNNLNKKVQDAPVTLTEFTSADNVINYTSSNPSVVSVEDNVINFLTEGNAVITASSPETSTHSAVTTTFTVTVTKTNQTITPTLGNITGIVYSTYTSLPSTTDQGFPIIYTSSSSNVIVNGNSLKFVNEGTATITVKSVGNVIYNDYQSTFNVIVTDPSSVYNGVGKFKKITSQNEFTEGFYVITNESDEFLMTNVFSGDVLQKENLNLVNGLAVDPSVNNVWKIANEGNNTFSISNNGKYVGWTSNNTVTFNTTLNNNSKWTFSYIASSTPYRWAVNNVHTAARQLSYNSGSPRFAAYGNNNQQELQLYKLITSTTWDGSSWSNGEPTSTVNAIIAGNLEISSDLNAKSVTVESTGAVTVKSGSTLKIENAVVNNTTADKFVVEAGGNLVQVNPNVTNIGQVTVYQNSRPMVRNDMTLWSSPVEGVNVKNFSPETLPIRFWTYNEGGSFYEPIFTGATDPAIDTYTFTKGKGIAIRSRFSLGATESDAHNGVFVGTLHNGDAPVAVTTTSEGYNLVGNPYASSIDVEDFLSSNTNVNTLYFWTHTYPVGSAQYNQNYAAFTRAGSVTSPELASVAVGQGFFVKVEPGTSEVYFNNGMRTTTAPYFYRDNTQRSRYWLSLNKGDQKMNQILIAYMTDATNNEDAQIDARLMNNDGNVIYTIIDNNAYAIQGRTLPFETSDIVKLGLNALEDGEFTIKLENKDGLFTTEQVVYLIDHLKNVTHNLTERPYTFTTNAGISNTRFELVYQNRTLGLNELTNNNKINVVTSKSNVRVISNSTEIAEIKIFDIQGKVVYNINNIKQKDISIPFGTKGVYVIKVKTIDGKELTQKFIK